MGWMGCDDISKTNVTALVGFRRELQQVNVICL